MLKIGDTVKLLDGSYAFGVKNGKYDGLPYCRDKGPFTVVKIGLKVLYHTAADVSGKFNATAGILITDNDDGYWFVPSRFARKLLTHTITFDDGEAIEISDESYNAMKKQFSERGL